MNLEKWEKIRSKGKKRFVLVNGVVYWGFSTAILWSAAMALFQSSGDMWLRTVIALILFPIGGIAFGHFTWVQSEKEYAKRQQELST